MKAYAMMAALCGAACSAALAVPAQAQTWQQIEARYTPAFQDCMDSVDASKGKVDTAMAQCMVQETARQDAKLAKVYNFTLTALQSEQQARLSADENEWKEKRTSVCRDTGKSLAGESKRQLAFAECMLDATIRRAIWLETYRP